ncbi:glycoside hydrolase family 88 protein [Fulvivirga ligni]|uniref:glycoside hydrolase family 88 protein n=1 Tax=Fulvivirga ligni TaxID=2904246 RepID=UPI001F28220B|nr:glycoside hydrolase family 88 protein [Fulvivirga ligni]UII23198.1 glycoside hydrolase family 88 protein [Fulvivirga ligni]
MNLRLNLFLLVISGAVIASCSSEKKQETDQNEELSFEDKLDKRLEYMMAYPVDSTAFPRSMDNGKMKKVSSGDWTSGFFPGSLLFAYQLTGDHQYLEKAEQWIPFIEKEQFNTTTHDMGFKVYCSFGNLYKTEPNEHIKEVIIQSAKTLAGRFNPEIGCIRSWDFGRDMWQFPVIIDNMMNLELLFEATKLTGDSSFHIIALTHAETTLKNHFRADNSSFHVVDYNPETGQGIKKMTHQGLADSSSWARGQAWGLYGFTMAYRYTHKPEFLDQANKIASYIINNPQIPLDNVPYWDYNDPSIPNAPRDASAAAITASALLELCTFSNNEKQKAYAQSIIETLSSDEYLINVEDEIPFILAHSTGNKPANGEIDVPINYADYYYLESLIRSK